MHLAPAGDRAILVDLGEVTAAELHAANARVSKVPGVVQSTPGHSSLYVIFANTPDRQALRTALETTDKQQPAASNATHRVAVHFDGENLEELLAHTGQSREHFLARVAGLRLTARYLGFRGGFAYLDGWPEEWAMPRRPTSRPVRRGSFAIAGSVAAFYPIDSPGGWNVLGHTDVNLENAIAAGDVLEIQVERRPLRPPTNDGRRGPRSPGDVEVVSATLAIWTSTPFDDLAAAVANHAVGNDATAPLFECPFAGPKLRFTRDAFIAWCTPDLHVTVERVKRGDERVFGRVTGGLRAYLAIGDREGVVANIERGERHVIRAMNGPHDVGLEDVECEVTPHLDRVGIRLRPLRALNVEIPADLRSIGMQVGTVQLHPDGSLVAMGPDHPITGGYLQPMTVISSERWKLAQLVPGERIVILSESMALGHD